MQKKKKEFFSDFELFSPHMLEVIIKHCSKEIYQQIFGVTDVITLKYEHYAYQISNSAVDPMCLNLPENGQISFGPNELSGSRHVLVTLPESKKEKHQYD